VALIAVADKNLPPVVLKKITPPPFLHTTSLFQVTIDYYHCYHYRINRDWSDTNYYFNAGGTVTGRCKRRASQRSSRYKCHSRIILSAVVEQFRDFSRLKSLTKQEFVFWCVLIQCLMRIFEYLQINGGITVWVSHLKVGAKGVSCGQFLSNGLVL
jgi:hypothetical protein